MNLIPNVSPKIFSGRAVIVGYLLIDDLTANEQNALGNWLMLTAQVLCTNAYYKQLLQERKNDTFTSKDEINMLKKVVEALTKEISILEQEIKK